MPARTRRSGSEPGLLKTASKGRGRPSQVTKVPALSVTGATGSTTSAQPGHVGLALLEADHERRGLEGGAGGGRVGGVVGVHAADDDATEAAVGERGDDRVAVAAGGLGQVVDAPRGGGVDAGRGVAGGTTAGQQGRQAAGLDRAAVTGPAGHPGEPGAGGAGELDGGRQGAVVLGQPLADEDDAAGVEGGGAVVGQRAQRLGLARRGRSGPAGPSSWPGRGW